MFRKAAKLLPIILCALVCYLVSGSFAGQGRSQARATFTDSLTAALQARTAAIFAKSCAIAGCHRGSYPKAKLRLEPETFIDAVRDAPSRQIDSLKLVDTKSPGKSYLIMKLRGVEGIKGNRMPDDAPALTQEQIRTIEIWAASLAAFEKTAALPPSGGDGN